MPKDETLRLRVTCEEKIQFEAAAKLSGLSLSAWLRKIANLNSAPEKSQAKRIVIVRGRRGSKSEDLRTQAHRQREDFVLRDPELVKVREKAVGHDPRTCRVYGCGMCKAAGVKNPKRGL